LLAGGVEHYVYPSGDCSAPSFVEEFYEDTANSACCYTYNTLMCDGESVNIVRELLPYTIMDSKFSDDGVSVDKEITLHAVIVLVSQHMQPT